MPEPSGSTGVQPSAEAIRASRRAMSNEAMRESWSPIGAARVGLAAAYSIDSPAIHAAGVVEGRAAVLREVVEWLTTGDRPYAFVADVVPQLVAHFPSEGTG